VNSVVYTTSQSGLRITNDGCTADQVLNLTVTPKPADVVTNATICSGASYTWSVNSVVYTTSQSGLRITNDGCTADQVLNLTVTPKPTDVVTNVTICSGASYTWSVNSVVYTTSQSGLRITNDGCTADQVLNLTVTPKPADVVTNATICSGASYTWSVNSVVYTTSQSGLRITNDGCTADQVLNLTVTPKPADVVTNATICSGDSYTWSVNSVVYTTSQSGLRITNDGCTADQVLNLTVTPKPADVVTNVTICSGDSYTWSVNSVVYTTSQSGLRITNDGCTADQVLNLTVTPLNQYYVDADGDGYGSTTSAMLCDTTAPSGYSINNTDCDDSNFNINPGASEISGNGIDDDCNPSTPDGSLEIDDFNINNINISPNPFNNKIVVKLPLNYNNSAFNIKVFDLNGRLVYEQKHYSNNGTITVMDIQNLEQAPYLVKITSYKTNTSILKRLIKF
ncbi:T9SS type A sorting domain-containing protein, partial [Mariniflexile jejuense]